MNEAKSAAVASPWRIIGWACLGVIAASVLACLGIAATRSSALASVTVTVLDADNEPQDIKVPLADPKSVLPDYQLIVALIDGGQISLGQKPNTSAVGGLTWQVANSLSVADVSRIRLEDVDVAVSDTIAEVQIRDGVVTENGYQFEFGVERSMLVGIQSFFKTPIGAAIAASFGIAIVIMVLVVFFQ